MTPKGLDSLSKQRDFAFLKKKGRSIYSRLTIIKFVKINENSVRVAIIVSQKVSKKAVVRNKIKRRIRYSLNQMKKHIKNGYNILIIVRTDSSKIPYQQIDEDLRKSFKKAALT